MRMNDFLERLSYGPLSNLSISNNGDGTIDNEKLPSVVSYINEALLRLYSKFDLAERELVLELQEGTTSYTLSSKYAVSQQDKYPDIVPYILDAADPYKDDLIKVLKVTENGGRSLALNDNGVHRSLMTPLYNVLQVPTVVQGFPLFVTYQAKHELLIPDGTLSSQEILLPDVLEEAAISYVAHKVFSYMNGQEHASKAADHLATYTSICSDVTDRDLVSSSQSNFNNKLHMRGFV